MLKLKICEIFTTCIFLPYVGIFVWLMLNKHPILAFIWVFIAAAVTVAVEDKVKAVIRKLKGK